jgi:nucleoside 2-deoxyribosyltransferase
VASPLGFFDAGKEYLVRTLVPKLFDFEVLDPWDLPESTSDALRSALAIPELTRQRAALSGVNFRIGQRNAELIAQSDAVLAILDGTDVDSGTACEIGYAAALGKKVIGLRTDFRLAADNIGSVVNLQVEYFIRSTGGSVASSVEAAVAFLQA